MHGKRSNATHVVDFSDRDAAENLGGVALVLVFQDESLGNVCYCVLNLNMKLSYIVICSFVLFVQSDTQIMSGSK